MAEVLGAVASGIAIFQLATELVKLGLSLKTQIDKVKDNRERNTQTINNIVAHLQQIKQHSESLEYRGRATQEHQDQLKKLISDLEHGINLCKKASLVARGGALTSWMKSSKVEQLLQNVDREVSNSIRLFETAAVARMDLNVAVIRTNSDEAKDDLKSIQDAIRHILTTLGTRPSEISSLLDSRSSPTSYKEARTIAEKKMDGIKSLSSHSLFYTGIASSSDNGVAVFRADTSSRSARAVLLDVIDRLRELDKLSRNPQSSKLSVDNACQLDQLAVAISALGETNEAVALSRRAVARCSEHEMPNIRGRLHLNLANHLRNVQSISEARKHAHYAVDLFRQAEEPLGLSTALITKANTTDSPSEAIKASREAVDIRKGLGKLGNAEPQADYASALVHHARILSRHRPRGYSKQALQHSIESVRIYEQIMELHPELHLSGEYAIALESYSQCLFNAGKAGQAIYPGFQAVGIHIQENGSAAKVLPTLGVLLGYLPNMENTEASSSLEKVLQCFSQVEVTRENLVTFSVNLRNTAEKFEDNTQHRMSRQLLDSALSILGSPTSNDSKDASLIYERARCLTLYADSFLSTKRTRKALPKADEAISLLQRLKATLDIQKSLASALSIKARCHRQLNQTQDAISALLDALKLYSSFDKSSGRVRDEIVAQHTLSQLYDQLGNTRSAVKHAKQAYTSCSRSIKDSSKSAACSKEDFISIAIDYSYLLEQTEGKGGRSLKVANEALGEARKLETQDGKYVERAEAAVRKCTTLP